MHDIDSEFHLSDINIITIDGPSGAGKGTVSKAIAKNLGWHFLDSGCIYRILAYMGLRSNIPTDEVDAIALLCENMYIEFKDDEVILNGEEISQELRTGNCGAYASKIAVYPKIRTALLAKQLSLAQEPGLVADGRDMGTVVFPYAKLKIFLDADVEIRAKRRLSQLQDGGFDGTIDDLIVAIRERDQRDRNREVAPLKPAPDAIKIDSSSMSVDDVVSEIMGLVRTAFGLEQNS